MTVEIFTLRERPDLRPGRFLGGLWISRWPEFVLHDSVARVYYGALYFDAYTTHAFAVVETGTVVGRGFSAPFAFRSDAQAPSIATVRVGYLHAEIIDVPLFYGLSKGYFQSRGIDLQFTGEPFLPTATVT